MKRKKIIKKSELTEDKSPELKDDLEKINVPFDLFTGLNLIVEEAENKGYSYSGLTEEAIPILTFKNKELERKLTINIETENLLVRDFNILEDGTRKLRVIYVVKPSERKFTLI